MCLDTKKCVSTYHRELVCPICLGLLCIDCVMDDNEHFYCKKCIFEWLRLGHSKCPIGNEPIEKEKLKSSRFTRSILSDLQVTCAFDEKGCTAIIRYEDLEKHEFECQFNIIICECGVTMQASLKKTHICKLELEKEKQRELKQKLEQQAIAKKK